MSEPIDTGLKKSREKLKVLRVRGREITGLVAKVHNNGAAYPAFRGLKLHYSDHAEEIAFGADDLKGANKRHPIPEKHAIVGLFGTWKQSGRISTLGFVLRDISALLK